MKSNLPKIAAFLALRQSIVALLTMVVLVGMGERLGERYLPIYLIAMGGSYLSIGFLSVLDNFLSAVYSYFGGALTGRLGHKRSLLVFNLMALLGFMIVVLIPTWQAVIAGAFFFLSWTAISHPATMSLIGRVLPAGKRTMGITMHSFVRRIPMGLGPILGGLFLDTWGTEKGIRLAFSLAAVMTIVAIILQEKLIDDDKPSQNPQPARKANPFALASKFRGGLRNLLIADILVRFCEQIPYAFVVIWCMKEIENPITFTQFGFLTALEMVTAMVIYIPIAVLADRLTKRPFILITFGFFTLFPLVLMFCHSFGWLAAAFIFQAVEKSRFWKSDAPSRSGVNFQ
ncbi:MAG: MFS transporter [Planctomycetes bacterium]|nr:MFS transporter [Planctomycetota bacterium]